MTEMESVYVPVRIPRPKGHWMWRTLLVYMLAVTIVFMAVALSAESQVLVEHSYLVPMTDDLGNDSFGLTVWEGCIVNAPPVRTIVSYTFHDYQANNTTLPYEVGILQSLLLGPSIGTAGADGYAYTANFTLTVVGDGSAFNVCVVSVTNESFGLTESYSIPWVNTW